MKRHPTVDVITMEEAAGKGNPDRLAAWHERQRQSRLDTQELMAYANKVTGRQLYSIKTPKEVASEIPD